MPDAHADHRANAFRSHLSMKPAEIVFYGQTSESVYHAQITDLSLW